MAPTEADSNSDQRKMTAKPDHNSHKIDTKKRLSKRLAYLLRYGAEKEGLRVTEGGTLLV